MTRGERSSAGKPPLLRRQISNPTYGSLPGAVIAGGHFLSLGAARNLAGYGIPVWVVDSEPCVAQFSRRVQRFLRCPPSEDEAGFLSFLLQLAANAEFEDWVLFPSTDDHVRIFAQHHEPLSRHYRLTIPPWDVVQYLYDKRLTQRLAASSGVPMPGTYCAGDIRELAALDVDFPLVLKPAITKHLMSVTKKKAYRANDRQELLALYEMMAGLMDPSEILIQDLIPGRAEKLFSYAGYFKAGVPVAGLSAKRSRQHPMDFGRASTFVEVVDIPELEELATQLLLGLSYTGLAEVEFMYDERDKRFELLEVNPRIWGWHTIAVRAGLDLPYFAYADAIGLEVPVRQPRAGVKWVRLVTDVPTALGEIRGGRLSVRQYLASLSGDLEFDVLSASDPLPFLADVLLVPYYAVHRGF
jgi:D-aspartate ligase